MTRNLLLKKSGSWCCFVIFVEVLAVVVAFLLVAGTVLSVGASCGVGGTATGSAADR